MWCKRLCLFLGVNLLVLLSVCIILKILPVSISYGMSLPWLLFFCFVWGMFGSLISLSLSKVLAKWIMGVTLIDPRKEGEKMARVVEITHRLAKKAGLKVMPEVGVFYDYEVNAFATGPSRNNSLVALSSSAIDNLSEGELSAVIGHEISHIANGDMVTMALLQGIVNTFVLFFARVLSCSITRKIEQNRNQRQDSSPFLYILIVYVLECVFMSLGSLVICFYSRRREFRADAGGAILAGTHNMIQALLFLQKEHVDPEPYLSDSPQKAFNAFKISNSQRLLNIFCTHPPMRERISRLADML